MGFATKLLVMTLSIIAAFSIVGCGAQKQSASDTQTIRSNRAIEFTLALYTNTQIVDGSLQGVKTRQADIKRNIDPNAELYEWSVDSHDNVSILMKGGSPIIAKDAEVTDVQGDVYYLTVTCDMIKSVNPLETSTWSEDIVVIFNDVNLIEHAYSKRDYEKGNLTNVYATQSTADTSAVAGGPMNDRKPTGGGAAPATREAKEAVARAFATAWLNDWTFTNGAMNRNQKSVPERCLQYVAPESNLYQQVNNESNFVGPNGMFFRGAAFTVVDTSVVEESSGVYRVETSVYGTQNDVTQEMYDKMRSDPSSLHVYTLILTVDDNGKICDMKQAGLS